MDFIGLYRCTFLRDHVLVGINFAAENTEYLQTYLAARKELGSLQSIEHLGVANKSWPISLYGILRTAE